MKILIVDDDELNVKILEEILEDADFQTVSAENGLEAMDRLKEHADVELILLDRMMPKMDGMQFMEEIKKQPEWENTPIIMQTAANQPKEVIEGTSAGAYYYLTKPFDEQVVLSVVRAAIDEMKSKAAS